MPDNVRVPPQDADAEESLLGAMMLTPQAIDAASEILDGSEFYRESNAKVFRAAVAMRERGDPVDVVTLRDELGGALDNVGGWERLRLIASTVPAAGSAGHYAKIVRDHYTRRSLIRAGGLIANMGWQSEEKPDVLIDQAGQITADLALRRRTGEFRTAAEGMRDAYKALMERAAHGRDVVGLPTGLADLDRLLSGFQGGQLVTLASRPSMGKSALALGICAEAAVVLELPVLLFTMEMSEHEVHQRLLSAFAHVDSQKVRSGKGIEANEWSRLAEAASRIEKAPLYVYDSAFVTAAEIGSSTRRMRAQHPVALVVVDYLQLMATDGKDESRVQEVSRISRSLKVLARELDLPVLALSQLSRAVEQRHDKRPILSDLRESGAIEQDSDVVLFLYRDEYYHPDEFDQQGLAELNVAKQRNGPTGTIRLAFVSRYALFSDLTPER